MTSSAESMGLLQIQPVKLNSLNELKGSESFRKLNPELFGVGRLEAAQSKPSQEALAHPALKQSRRQGGMVACISLIASRNRLCDDDNNVASFKPLRDAIAQTLGFDDGDKRLIWSYSQIQTNGTEGAIVKIELKNKRSPGAQIEIKEGE